MTWAAIWPAIDRDDAVRATATRIVDDLAAGAQDAIRFTKHSLNYRYRQFAPAVETALGLEFGQAFPGPMHGKAWSRSGRNLSRGSAPASGGGSIHIDVYRAVLSRTNIEIDDDLVAAAQRLYRLESKRSAVDLALRRLVGEALSIEEALALQGTGFDYTIDQVEAFSAPKTDKNTSE